MNHLIRSSSFVLLGLALVFLQACNKEEDSMATEPSSPSLFSLSSAAIENGELLEAYKCEEKDSNGVENSLPLAWSNVPANTQSLAVVMKHYPKANDSSEVNSYLLLWDIDPSVSEIPYGYAHKGDWYMGANKDGNHVSYTSPCSPSPGSHSYILSLYALSETPPTLPDSSSVAVDYEAMMEALSTVTIIEEAVLEFEDVND